MSQPQGLGRPGPNQPDFQNPPTVAPTTTSNPPYPSAPPGPYGTGAPSPQTGPQFLQTGPQYAPAGGQDAAPGQYPPPRPRNRWVLTTGIAAVVVALIVGGVGLYASWTSTPESPPRVTPTATARPTLVPSVVRSGRATPEASPTTVQGGQIGRPTAFKGLQGSGVVTVTAARWTNSGLMNPEPGQSYLILDLEVTATSGSVTAGMIWCRVVDPSDTPHIFTFGPKLTDLLETALLSEGETAKGQVGFQLARGPVTFEMLDEELRTVAEVSLP